MKKVFKRHETPPKGMPGKSPRKRRDTHAEYVKRRERNLAKLGALESRFREFKSSGNFVEAGKILPNLIDASLGASRTGLVTYYSREAIGIVRGLIGQKKFREALELIDSNPNFHSIILDVFQDSSFLLDFVALEGIKGVQELRALSDRIGKIFGVNLRKLTEFNRAISNVEVSARRERNRKTPLLQQLGVFPREELPVKKLSPKGREDLESKLLEARKTREDMLVFDPGYDVSGLDREITRLELALSASNQERLPRRVNRPDQRRGSLPQTVEELEARIEDLERTRRQISALNPNHNFTEFDKQLEKLRQVLARKKK